MDFLEFVRNNEIEIFGNKIYKRYYSDSYSNYEIQDRYCVGFEQKFWVKENGSATDYILVVDYSFSGDFRGYKIKKGIDEKEVGYLCRLYGSSREYYKFQPFFTENCKNDLTIKQANKESSSSYSSSSSSNSETGVSGFAGFIIFIWVFFFILGSLLNLFIWQMQCFWIYGVCFGVAAIVTIVAVIIHGR